HIPLIVRAPGIKGGERRTPLIESIDIYPTLCDLTGIPQPKHLKGQSFVGLMKDSKSEWKQAAVSRFKNGDTIRTDQFRYTEYSLPKGKQVSQMLYDHSTDPLENVNISAQQTDAVKALSAQLDQLKGRNRKPGKNKQKQ
ncbi:MAG: iduronate sulfatase, partial [Planctomycetaceae bacterium]|nr:iduronate sulfatase [Planctomycetaceae bacterium]